MKHYFRCLGFVVLALSALTSAVPAESSQEEQAKPVAPCVRQIALTQLRVYACQRIVSYHAEMARPVLTDMIVVKKRTDDAHDPHVIFGSNESPEICGTLRFVTLQFNKTNVEAADAVLALQGFANDAFIEVDPEIQQQSNDIADSVIDAPSEPQNETRARGLQNIDAAIKTLDRKMRAAVGQKALTPYAPDRCGAIVSNSGISLPIVRGPDLTALAKYKDASTDYAKFEAWLGANAFENSSNK